LDVSIPDLTYFQQVFESSFFRIDEIRRYEIYCLKNLQYKLNFVTSFDIIKHFLTNGIIFDEDFRSEDKKEFKHFSRIYEFLYEILDFTIQSNNKL
jgi:hypothetical protein